MIRNLEMSYSKTQQETDRLVKSTLVMIGTADHIYFGHIIHFSSERLLDVLNYGSEGNPPEIPPDFLQIQDVRTYELDGQETTSPSNCIIGKNSILFVGEEKSPDIRSSRLDRKKNDLFTQKKAIWVEIHVPSFNITGQVYIEPWQRLVGILSDTRNFLPVTGARISSRQKLWTSKLEFAIINRNQIQFIATAE
jgi:hypothetical protein